MILRKFIALAKRTIKRKNLKYFFYFSMFICLLSAAKEFLSHNYYNFGLDLFIGALNAIAIGIESVDIKDD